MYFGETFQYLLLQERKRPGNNLGITCTMREAGPQRRPGLIKTKENTVLMLRFLSQKLQADQLHFSSLLMGGMQSGGAFTQTSGMTREEEATKAAETEARRPIEMRNKLLQQMREYKCERRNAKDAFGDPRFKWMGMHEDDLLVSAMEAAWGYEVFCQSEYSEYLEFRRRVLGRT